MRGPYVVLQIIPLLHLNMAACIKGGIHHELILHVACKADTHILGVIGNLRIFKFSM